MIKALHIVLRYVIHLYDLNYVGLWEHKGRFVIKLIKIIFNYFSKLATLQRHSSVLFVSNVKSVPSPTHVTIGQSVAVNGLACYMHAYSILVERVTEAISKASHVSTRRQRHGVQVPERAQEGRVRHLLGHV